MKVMVKHPERTLHVHLTERENVPRYMWDYCWVCHEVCPPYGEGTHREQFVFDATVMARYHFRELDGESAPCNVYVDSRRMIYDRSTRGRRRPEKQLRRAVFGGRCATCRDLIPRIKV